MPSWVSGYALPHNKSYSFPNYIPLNAAAVRGVADIVALLAFDRIYGAW